MNSNTNMHIEVKSKFEYCLKILDRPFFVTFLGGTIIAIAGYLYQNHQVKIERQNELIKLLRSSKTKLQEEFITLSSKRMQVLGDQNEFTISIASELGRDGIPDSILIEAWKNKLSQSNDAVRDLRPTSSVLFQLLPILNYEYSRGAVKKYMEIESDYVDATNSLTNAYTKARRRLERNEIHMYDSALSYKKNEWREAAHKLTMCLTQEIYDLNVKLYKDIEFENDGY